MKIKYFAWIKDITNLEQEEINLSKAKNLDELKTYIIEKYPDLKKHMIKEILRFAINQEYVVKNTNLKDYKLGYYSNYYEEDSLYRKNIDLLKSKGANLIKIEPQNISLPNFRKLLDEDMRTDLVKYLNDYGNENLLVKDIKSIIDYNSLDSVTRSTYGQGIFEGIIKDTMSKTDFKLLKEIFLKNCQFLRNISESHC